MRKELVALGCAGMKTAEGMWGQDLQEQGVIKVEDAVYAYREPDGSAARVHYTASFSGKGGALGAGGGLLAGLLLDDPLIGAVAGALVGEIAVSLKGYDIDRAFIANVVVGLEPDRSFPFLLGEAIERESLRDNLRLFKASVLRTSLSG